MACSKSCGDNADILILINSNLYPHDNYVAEVDSSVKTKRIVFFFRNVTFNPGLAKLQQCTPRHFQDFYQS
jgi:hypothetical protein